MWKNIDFIHCKPKVCRLFAEFIFGLGGSRDMFEMYNRGVYWLNNAIQIFLIGRADF